MTTKDVVEAILGDYDYLSFDSAKEEQAKFKSILENESEWKEFTDAVRVELQSHINDLQERVDEEEYDEEESEEDSE